MTLIDLIGFSSKFSNYFEINSRTEKSTIIIERLCIKILSLSSKFYPFLSSLFRYSSHPFRVSSVSEGRLWTCLYADSSSLLFGSVSLIDTTFHRQTFHYPNFSISQHFLDTMNCCASEFSLLMNCCVNEMVVYEMLC